MARRKSKKLNPEEEAVVWDSPVLTSNRRPRSRLSPALLIFLSSTIVGCVLAWFCVQQQNNINELEETLTAMQHRVINLQRNRTGLEITQTNRDLSLEQRIFVLNKAHKHLQEQTEVALVTSHDVQKSDLLSLLSPLQTEMNVLEDEIQQATLYVTSLQTTFKNQSEEVKGFREKVENGLNLNTQLTEKVDILTSTSIQLVDRLSSLEMINAQIRDQASQLGELHGLLYLHKVALHIQNRDMAAVRKAVEAKRTSRSQALKELLSSVRVTLDQQFFTSETLHSTMMAQLQNYESKLLSGLSNKELVSIISQVPTEQTEVDGIEINLVKTLIDQEVEAEDKEKEKEGTGKDNGQEEFEETQEEEDEEVPTLEDFSNEAVFYWDSSEESVVQSSVVLEKHKKED